ncbi:alanine racemase [Thiorhodospira sibirica]|uniref:alanine racemase n=1 Tax=Thiorhodospira sibirica TaxID=154347 RepID=UPI00022C0476|nr:alanine racemase [Thiorhodospira sibirica]
MKRSASKWLDLEALRANASLAVNQAGAAEVLAVIKANAYGHGMLAAAEALADRVAGFAVSCVTEAMVLREAGIRLPIVVLQGFQDVAQLRCMAQLDLWPVIHQDAQLSLLDQATLKRPLHVWIKLDSGMHRLGFALHTAPTLHQRLLGCANVAPDWVWMTHLACADEPLRGENSQQRAQFAAAIDPLPGGYSLANSAALLSPLSQDAAVTSLATKAQWVRPGIMLYGASPLAGQTAASLGLQAVMTVTAPLIAINHLPAGACIGYGGTYVCPHPMRVGVVAIGYADGYPRHAPSGTPVLIHGQTVPRLGRVSMDMISIDLSSIPHAQLGDTVTLWGNGLAVDDIAQAADTIAYDLLCGVSGL